MNKIITEKLAQSLETCRVLGTKLFVRDISTSRDYHIGEVGEKDIQVSPTIEVGMQWEDDNQTYKVVDIIDGYAIITRRWGSKVDEFGFDYEKIESLSERLPKVTKKCIVWQSLYE